MPRAPLIPSLALSLLLACSSPVPGGPGGVTSYTLPTAPDAVVLRLQAKGSMTGWTSTHTLHADGRLDILLLDRDHTTVRKSITITLPPAAVDAIFTDALAARLLEIDQATLNHELRALLGTTSVSEDDALTILELSVADLTRDGVSLGPRQNSLTFEGPTTLSRAAPGVAPLVAFIRIYQRLVQAEKEASSHSSEAPQ